MKFLNIWSFLIKSLVCSVLSMLRLLHFLAFWLIIAILTIFAMKKFITSGSFELICFFKSLICFFKSLHCLFLVIFALCYSLMTCDHLLKSFLQQFCVLYFVFVNFEHSAWIIATKLWFNLACFVITRTIRISLFFHLICDIGTWI